VASAAGELLQQATRFRVEQCHAARITPPNLSASWVPSRSISVRAGLWAATWRTGSWIETARP